MDNNDEYHIPELEPSSVYQAERVAPEPEPESKKFNIKKIAVIAGGVVLIYVFYKILLGLFTTPDVGPPKSAVVTNLEQPKSVPPAETTPPGFSDTELTPIQTPVPPPMPTVSENRIASLEEANAEMRTRLEKQDANISEIQTTLASLAGQMMTLSTNLQTLTVQLQQAKPVAKPAAAKRKATAAPKVKQYYIQALVPGRAWLRADNGELITVRLGDEISGYGVVDNINIAEGLVNTSSGKVIQFSSEES